MIVSASRRTDIPALYSDWLIERLRAGYLLVPHPRNPDRLGRVALSPDGVDCIAFWTKNPAPMLDKLPLLDAMGYRYYIQFTLTPYGSAIERHLPPKPELMRAFARMSARIGPVRSVWRYDPILIDDDHTVTWHIGQFAGLCAALGGLTERCVLSFIDPTRGTPLRAMTQGEMTAIAAGFSDIAGRHGISLFTCAEEIDLSAYGIAHSACIDQALVEQIIGCPIRARADTGQRPACRCIESVDIGVYNTCLHGCTYCYATTSIHTARQRVSAHRAEAPMLTGWPRGDELVTDRTTPSQRIDQIGLF